MKRLILFVAFSVCFVKLFATEIQLTQIQNQLYLF